MKRFFGGLQKSGSNETVFSGKAKKFPEIFINRGFSRFAFSTIMGA